MSIIVVKTLFPPPAIVVLLMVAGPSQVINVIADDSTYIPSSIFDIADNDGRNIPVSSTTLTDVLLYFSVITCTFKVSAFSFFSS